MKYHFQVFLLNIPLAISSMKITWSSEAANTLLYLVCFQSNVELATVECVHGMEWNMLFRPKTQHWDL